MITLIAIFCTVAIMAYLVLPEDLHQVRKCRARINAYVYGRIFVWTRKISQYCGKQTELWIRDLRKHQRAIGEINGMLDELQPSSHAIKGGLYKGWTANDPGPGNSSINSRRIREACADE